MADFLSDTGKAITDPLVTLWNSLVETLPGIVAAIIVIIVGYIVSGAIGWVVRKALEKTKLDEKIEESGRGDAIGHLQLSRFFGKITKWYIFVAFLVPATYMLNLGHLSDLLRALVLWLPNLIGAAIIVVFGLIGADFVADKINEMKGKFVPAAALFVRLLIIFFVADIALKEIGIAVDIAESTFLILLAGIVFAVSLAFGLGFGLGGLKDESKKMIVSMKAAGKKKKK